MSEEFVRCSNCGNLNIKGTTKCVFCDVDIGAEADIIVEDVVEYGGEIPVTEPTTIPEVITSPPPSSVPQIEEGDIKEETVVSSEILKKEKKEKPIKLRTQFSVGKKIVLISIFSILVSIIHFGMNFLVSFLSINITDPNIDIYPTIPTNLSSVVEISAVSVILGIPFAIIIGYIFGKLARTYSDKKKVVRFWIIYMIFIDLIINVGLSIILIILTNAYVGRDILFIYLIGVIFIFILFSVVSLLIPMLIGSYLLFNKFDDIYFQDKSS